MDVGIVYTIISIVVLIYLMTSVLYIIRLIKGPTVPDRILALDALSYDLSVFIALLALLLRRPIVASGLIALTLWIHALDIYVSKYIEAREIGE
ncbi:MAG: monovalent cation/H+ antiporter complex subunit F [Ignisphaera sp.]|nr:monovalent cation/H+ antiporter complex subunit F [Ignisphaera sp.]MCX8167636.1 monovalent cation/H+ antiporter complex subunit F [Ignisphaera sp.]MDW8085953.1 monovalent cation/H+ antiporter complex subunit F [Ignisphaera sp.]